MAQKQALLVAGFDYEGSGVSFVTLAKNRMARLMKAFPASKLVFVLFDVGGGVISKSEIVNPKKKDTLSNRRWTTIKTFTAVTSANYSSWIPGQENAFDQHPAGTMSIVDIYQYAEGIGASKDAQSVIELSFFCHGWMGGPILVNSFDPTSDDATKPRDPGDRDARQVKDFIPPTTKAAELRNFTHAFATGGIIWIWGCAFARAYNIVLGKLFATPKYKSKAPGKLKDSAAFKLEFTEDKSKSDGTLQFDAIVNDILPGGTVTPAPRATAGRTYEVKKTMRQIKQAYKSALGDTYSATIAGKTHIRTFGALLGTYADYEKPPPPVSNPLMLIPRRVPPYSDNFSRTITFYHKYLNVTIDPEGRGYGQYPI